MAPKPKTAGRFVKADIQTLNRGEISHDGQESKLKPFFASGGFVDYFDFDVDSTILQNVYALVEWSIGLMAMIGHSNFSQCT